MNSRSKRVHAVSAVALVAVVVACSNEDTGKAALGAVPTATADAQTSPASPAKAAKITGPAKPLPTGVYAMQLVQIPNSNGPISAPIAARALIPQGWTADGAAIWPADAARECADHYTYAWSATGPDGKSSFELFPTEMWNASNSLNLPCTQGQFQDVESYLRAFASAHVPGATNFQFRQRQDLLEPQRPQIEFEMQMVNVQYAANGTRFWPDAGELTFTYNDGGTQMKGVIGATARFYLSQAPNAFTGVPLTTLVGQTNYTYAASFPAATFDAQLVELMRKSVKPDYLFLDQASEYALQVSIRKTGIVKQRSEFIVAAGYALTRATIERNQAAANAAVAKSYADAPITSGGSDDRSQRERIESIRGVETYDDPVYGGTVQLDNTYDHAWRVNNNDSYILTNDPNFNPGLYNIDAQQLKISR